MNDVVILDQAKKDYGTRVIGPLTFSVHTGEVVGLVGPNGSGKTTTIRLTLGLIRPTSGRVLVNGYEPNAQRTLALDGVGYSPELPNLPSFFTPRELLRLVAGELGIGARFKDAIDETLETVGLLNYADTKIAKLSKGMVQRLSIAQALLGEPRVLVLDEPLIGVDPIGVDHLKAILANFASSGGTVILSSHQLSEVEDSVTSVVAFRRGRVMFSGTLDELRGRVLGEREIRLQASGVTESVLEKIRSTRGVLEVQTTSSGAVIRVMADEDIRPKIARLIIESGCELKEIRYTNTTLVELYRRAVRDGAENES